METLSNDLNRLLLELLTQLPSLFTMLICIIVAIVRWKRHPRVSLIVILALTLLALENLVFSAVFIWVPRWAVSLGHQENSQAVYTVLSSIFNLGFALALGFLLLGVFIKRPATQSH